MKHEYRHSYWHDEMKLSVEYLYLDRSSLLQVSELSDPNVSSSISFPWRQRMLSISDGCLKRRHR
jgi:hypothetical protein